MRTVVLRAAGLVCAAVAVAALGASAAPAFAAPSGNPLAGLTADQIASKAFADLQAASSVQITGSGISNGITDSLNMTVTKTGCKFWGELGKGFVLNVLQIGSKAWTQLTASYLKVLGYSGAQLSSLEGKWLATPANKDQCELTGPSDFPRAGWVTVKRLTVHGEDAIELFHAAEQKSGQADMDVSASATPEILRIFAKGSAMNFSKYNAPVRLTPPPASEVVTSLPKPS